MITQDDSVAVNEPCGKNDFHRSHKKKMAFIHVFL